MPDDKKEKKGFIETLKDRFTAFVKGGSTAGKQPKGKPPVDTSRVSRKPLRPQPNAQQKRAIAGKKSTTKRSGSRSTTSRR